MDLKGTQSCRIRRFLQVKYDDDTLKKVAERTTKFKLSILEQVLVFLSMVLEALVRHLNNHRGTIFRGIRIGVTETEFGIRVGSLLTTYGEVIYDRLQKSLKIEYPLFFFTSKSRFLQQIQSPLTWKYFSVFFASMAILGSGFMLIRSVKRCYKEWLQNVLSRKKDTFNDIKQLTIEDYDCKICKSSPRNIILKPCLHFVICHSCAQKPETKVCPQCHKSFDSNVEIFFP